MRIILCAFDEALQRAWENALRDFPGFAEEGLSIEVHRGDITTLAVSAVVSPANSHGYMRGGVDLAYTNHFGVELETALRRIIATLPGALLPVGKALAVPTRDKAIPFLVSAPTMETPRRLSGPEPVLAATRAAVRCAVAEGYESLAFPGMGTGTGGLSLDVAVRAMLQGIREGLAG